MHAGQHRFLIAERAQQLDLAHHVIDRPAAPGSPRNRSHAESAGVIAAVLRLDEGTGAGEMLRRVSRNRLGVERFERLPRQRRHQLILAFVVDHPRDPRQHRDLVGRDLRVAARDRDRGVAGAVKLAHQLAAVVYRVLSHGAGVDHDLIRQRRIIDNFVPLLLKLPRHRLDFALVQAAAEHS